MGATKDAYWFSHDSNAKDDPKCVLLIEQLGLEGYGIFWVLVETLRDQPGYKYPLDLLPAIARRFNTSTQKMAAVVNGYGLFEITEDSFFSLSLRRRMEVLDTKRQLASIAGKKSGEARKTKQVERPLNDRSTNKVNNTKEQLINTYTENDDLKNNILSFIEMRKVIKKPLTDNALSLILTKLDKLANNDDEKNLILEQSIMNSWQGIFPLKEEMLRVDKISKPLSMQEMQKAALQMARQKGAR